MTSRSAAAVDHGTFLSVSDPDRNGWLGQRLEDRREHRPICDDPPVDERVRNTRIAVVRDHMEAENRLDFDAVIATFARPRYELMAGGQVFDGEDEVRRYFAESRRLFPDQRNENVELQATDDAVVAEFDLLGTHRDTGRSFRSRMVALFFFEGERIVCERVYFDRRSVDEQVRR